MGGDSEITTGITLPPSMLLDRSIGDCLVDCLVTSVSSGLSVYSSVPKKAVLITFLCLLSLLAWTGHYPLLFFHGSLGPKCVYVSIDHPTVFVPKDGGCMYL
jgi:hypothetical protein